MNIMTSLNVSEFHQGIKKHSIIIDVRTEREFDEGFIKGAFNFDFFKNDFLDNFKELKKEEPLYLYCRSGKRSYNALQKLAALGFSKIYDLKGGYISWKQNF